MRRKILAIAINEYDSPELNTIANCKSDINLMVSTLEEHYYFEETTILEKKEETTRKYIMGFIQDYLLNSLKDESILIIYAGHGTYNEKIKSAYWQPSDADNTDFSSWININEIKAMIKASEAFHISIISDSCFSGALLESNFRGGGLKSYNKLQSREALTSGSLEKVLDGEPGEISPFAKTVVDVLNENEHDEMSFLQFSTVVIERFSSKVNQTPLFGSIVNSGHRGGSFLFQRQIKSKNESNINSTIKEQLGSLYLPFAEKQTEQIAKLNEIKELKNVAVKTQEYTDAADLRDEETRMLKNIEKSTKEAIDELFPKLRMTADEEDHFKRISNSHEEFMKQREEQIRDFTAMIKKYSKNLQEDIDYGSKAITISPAYFAKHAFSVKLNPVEELLKSSRSRMFEVFQSSLQEMILLYIKTVGTLAEGILEKKTLHLKKLVESVYRFQINTFMKTETNVFQNLIEIKKIELSFLNWLENRNEKEVNNE